MDSDKPAKYRQDDLVMIVKQPENMRHLTGLIGARGFVEAVRGVHPSMGRMYTVYTFRRGQGDGATIGGTGTIPEDCLGKCDDADLKKLKREHDEKIGQLADEAAKRAERHDKGVFGLAKKHGVDPKVAKALIDDYLVSDFRS